MTRDMSYQPSPGNRAPRKRRIGWIVAALVAVNVAVFIYHGDPRRFLSPPPPTVTIAEPAPAPHDDAMLPIYATQPPASVSLAFSEDTDSSSDQQQAQDAADISESVAAASDAGPVGELDAQDDASPLPAEVPIADDGFVGPPFALDPLVGLRSPGLVQRVERLKLRNGQTPAAALQNVGVSSDEISGALASMAGFIDFRRMRPGDDLKARFDAENRLVSLDVSRGLLDQARTKRTGSGWQGEKIDVAVDTVIAEVSGQVTSSLWDALIGVAGEDPRLVQALVDIFAYEIDFYTEIHPNDAFCLLVEKRYANGRFLDYGDVAAAEFVTGETPHRAFMHRSEDGTASYYDEHGDSMRKQLLKAPLKYAPVTSTFGVRKHPILGYTRNHNGTDYGVPIGTPVWSVGDGRVVTAGMHSGFGKLVEVMHPNGWLSQYAHLSKINVRVGQHVQQKDIVGLVGMTGLATGPHLHYGLKKNGHYVNSLLQKFERAKSLAGLELTAFSTQVAKLIDDLSKLRVAQQSNGAPQKG